MTERRGWVEQRNQRRFKAEDGTYALLRGPVSKLGQIVDISRGGFAFRYIDIGERPEGSFELDIFLRRDGFSLEKVGFKTVSDFLSNKEFPFSSIRTRRRGGQLVALSEHQISRLEYFIRNHTRGEIKRSPLG